MNDNNKKDKTDYIKGNFKRRVLDISKLVFYVSLPSPTYLPFSS